MLFMCLHTLQQHALCEYAYSCPVCGKLFAYSSNLVNHQRLYTGLKLYACHVCGKLFAQPLVFDRHQRIHTEVKPYFCQICIVNHLFFSRL